MSKNRYSKAVDENQPHIVASLRKLNGVTVELDCNDILVGYKGRNYFIEIKDPSKTLRKDGRIKTDIFKKSQIDLMRSWKGQYSICWTFMDCLDVIGYKL